MSSTNPYADLDPSRYWKSGVQQRADHPAFGDIWQPKFGVSADDIFVTAGSCFAQHISKWLSKNHYNWLDTEPAPEGMSPELAERDGHGVFSFRTGNIYTAALLRQWVSWALGRACAVDDISYESGRYYDLLRPTIPAQGYEDEDQLRDARALTLRAFGEGLATATVFVFTLGLTEAWQHADGYVYPMCPGTLRGVFDEDVHSFVNFAHDQVVDDLEFTFAAIREINPNIRFLLTVSPVPLTATASEQHVLTATTYSKAVLRAAAGDLCARFPDVDYFPSFELIATHPQRGTYYEENLRTVRPAGVNFVMSHFAAGAGLRTAAPALTEDAAAEMNVFCEDESLETWSGGSSDADVLLLGSSHMGRLADALTAFGVLHLGGRIMDGSRWYNGVFVLDDESYVVPLQDRSARQRWEDALQFFDRPAGGSESQRVVLTDLTMQSHMAMPEFREIIGAAWSGNWLAPAVEFFTKRHAKQLMLLRRILNEGFSVCAITDPPTQHVGGFGEVDLRAFAA